METRYQSRGRFNRRVNQIKGFKNIKLIEPEKKRENETLNYKQKLFHLSQDLSHRKDL